MDTFDGRRGNLQFLAPKFFWCILYRDFLFLYGLVRSKINKKHFLVNQDDCKPKFYYIKWWVSRRLNCMTVLTRLFHCITI